MSAGACFEPHTSAPSIAPNAERTFANWWSTTASSPYSAQRSIQRPMSSSRPMRVISSSGIGPAPVHHWSRELIIDPNSTVLMI